MISFIVPAYNEETELPSTLGAIRAAISALSQPFEIIVVDDASTDATPEIAEQAGARVVPIHRRQIAAARGGGARGVMDGFIPLWSRILLHAFCTLYFGLNLGAGAFLFTTRRNFEATGGFDEQYFAGEEVYFSLALRKLGRFKVLREPVLTSGRKLRMYPAKEILGTLLVMILGGPRAARSRDKLDVWYDGKRENRTAET